MFLKTQVIVNPESDKGKTRKRWKYIKEGLKSFLKEFKYEFTDKNKKLRLKIDDEELPLDEYMIGAISNYFLFMRFVFFFV